MRKPISFGAMPGSTLMALVLAVLTVLVTAGRTVAAPAPTVPANAALPAASTRHAAPDAMSLWYQQPAARWLEALPIGNGRVGGMVFGQPDHERLELSQTTLWCGGPMAGPFNPRGGANALAKIRALMLAGNNADAWKLTRQTLVSGMGDYGTNLPGGAMLLEHEGVSADVRDYRRALDLNDAVASVDFTAGGTRYHRQVIASHPDGVIAIHLTADAPQSISFKLSYDPGRLPCTATIQGPDSLRISGHAYGPNSDGASGVAFDILFHVIAQGQPGAAVITASNNAIHVSRADRATVLIAFETDYHGAAPLQTAQREIAAAAAKGWERLRADHLADYQRLFNRVSLHLGGDAAAGRPTDARLAALRAGHADPALEALFFQYARYLMIAASRADSPLPMHLQGIWNDNIAAQMGWTCDYHLNINMQQNYWSRRIMQSCAVRPAADSAG